ncbi:sensor histidine kinase [Kitasatospora viridis]|uniref:histidine kinase n=1 Tax=Kitasatospora viridis TaxID=281105 RepID=A0A561UNX3_9ACTN|nr:nitrate- and nitrite sensing domain-containing protein [Kitasatospora viridis]TWG01057.1 signal transduction histidine kinase [Kitasatospora viridis]
MDLVRKTGQPGSVLMFSLQEERRLTAASQTQPGASTDALKAQRQKTDTEARAFLASSNVSMDNVPSDIKATLAAARNGLGDLSAKRSAIDSGSLDATGAFTYYTGLIGNYLEMFTSLSHVDDGTVAYLTRPLVGEFWVMELMAREDTELGMGWSVGQLPPAVYTSVSQNIGAQAYIFGEEVSTRLPANESALIQKLGTSDGWQVKGQIEQEVFKPAAPNKAGMMVLPPMGQQWRSAMDSIRPQITELVTLRATAVLDNGQQDADSLLNKVITTTLIGLVAVIIVVLVTWRLTGSLRRRIVGLTDQAGELERTLPEVVERLARGEQVDPAAASRAIATGDTNSTGGDELDRLGQALNLARASAVGTAVRQAEQHRGFEKLLQRIARRTQLLIGLQLKTLNEMERRHEDPEVLEGLFDLDHLTARLRRYEENLVILGGGQPQRRWRKPVPLLDVLRSAQGEVQDYRRILIDVEGSPWLSERAVGPVVHVLAELMENAATFSKPPSPVEVRAALVGRGLAVEVEDRGLGMEQAQYDAANALMRSTPRMDVLAQADDVRLGLYVVARLAATLGLQVEFRPSAFGGTRAVVLIPGELVSRDPNAGYGGYPTAVPDPEPEPLPVRSAGATLSGETYDEAEAYNEFEADLSSTSYQSYDESYDAPSAETWTEPLEPVPAPRPSWATRVNDHERTVESVDPPLPQRVRQASLAAELRTPPPAGMPAAPVEEPAPTRARSGATTIGAFQRRSRAARYEQTGEIMQFPNPAQFPAPTTEDQS